MVALYSEMTLSSAIIVLLVFVVLPIALLIFLVTLLIKLIKKPTTKAEPTQTSHTNSAQQQPSTYQTGWTWNENKQLWEPPAGTKTVQQEPPRATPETTYRFSKGSIHQDSVPHNSQRTATQPNTTYSFTKASIRQDDIPHNDWRTMDQPQKPQQAAPAASSADRYVMPNPGGIQGYKSKYLLTKNEWHEHKKLREYAARKGLQVCPKVRMLDLVTPYGYGKDYPGYTTRLHKVQSKHVDFVLVDENMHVRAIVELDDASHDDKERQERDQFVDEVLTGVGYTVIHTRCITEQTLSRL